MATKIPKTTVEKGWRIELLSPNGWTHVNERPFHKTRAKNAARTWTKFGNGKLRVRIAKVRLTTETFTQEEV